MPGQTLAYHSFLIFILLVSSLPHYANYSWNTIYFHNQQDKGGWDGLFFFLFKLQDNLALSSLTKSLGEVSQPLLHLCAMLSSGALPAWTDELQWRSLNWCEWHTAPAEVRCCLLGKTGGIFRTQVPHSENAHGSQLALKPFALTGMKFPFK